MRMHYHNNNYELCEKTGKRIVPKLSVPFLKDFTNTFFVKKESLTRSIYSQKSLEELT